MENRAMSLPIFLAETVEVHNTPSDIPGLRFRRFRDTSDYAAIANIIQAANAADGIDDFFSAEEITSEYTHLANFDPAQDLLLAEINGTLIGYSRLNWWREEDGTRIYYLSGDLHPDWRRKGIGRAMVRHTERRAQALHDAASNSNSAFLHSSAYTTQTGAQALLEQEGFSAVRYSFMMVRPDLNHILDAPLPPGLEVRPTQPEHYRAIWEAKEEAFRDHWGHRAPTEDKYQQWLNNPFFNSEWWQVAWDGAEVAGMVLTYVIPEENEYFQRRRGYTESIGVRRPWRKRGLARALLTRSLQQLKDKGFTEAALHVDTENASGALQLYESVGFRVVRRESAYRKPLK
jgi:mycothiol synthase